MCDIFVYMKHNNSSSRAHFNEPWLPSCFSFLLKIGLRESSPSHRAFFFKSMHEEDSPVVIGRYW